MIRLNGLAPRRVVAPAKLPVTLAEAKAHLRVEHAESDAQITAMLQAAVSHFDGWQGVLGRCMIAQGWQIMLGGWPCGRIIDLPFPDCSAASITCLDQDGATQTLAGSGFMLLEAVTGTQIAIFDDTALPALKPSHPAPVTVSFTAGFGADEADVPAALRHAILLMLGDMWHARESFVVGARVSEVPSAAAISHLIAGFRRSGLAGL